MEKQKKLSRESKKKLRMKHVLVNKVNKDEDHDDDEGGSNLTSRELERESWSKAVQVSWAGHASRPHISIKHKTMK